MSNVKHITIVGFFCKGKEAYNGQTTKARNYARGLSEKYGKDKICIVDTDNWKKRPWLFFSLIFLCLKSDIVAILPNQNGLKLILPICVLCKKIRKFKLLYPVVGGWLPQYTQKNTRIRKYLLSVDKIYVETKAMLSGMQRQGFKNVEYAPVFTYRKGVSEPTRVDALRPPYKLCTFSRITPEKGIALAIKAVDRLNEKYGGKKYVLEIYGFLEPSYEKELNSLISRSKYGSIKCYGPLEDKNVIATLSKYDAMLFPTYYPGEGFPATLLESMLASTPIIASDWRYNSEIVIPGKNGFLFDLNDGDKGLSDTIEQFFSDAESVSSMRKACIDISKRYRPEFVMAPMFQYIEEN